MSISTLPIPDLPAFTEDLVIADIPYRVSMYWNTRGQFWVLSFYDRTGNPLVLGIKMVSFYALTAQYKSRGIPEGEFYVLDTNIESNLERIGRRDFVDDRQLQLIFISQDEIDAL